MLTTMVARPGAFLLLPIPLLMFACGGEDRQGAPRVTQDTVAEESWTPPRLPAYETIAVSNGGAVTGTVRLTEAMPPLADIPVLKNQAACGEHRPDILGVGAGKRCCERRRFASGGTEGQADGGTAGAREAGSVGM